VSYEQIVQAHMFILTVRKTDPLQSIRISDGFDLPYSVLFGLLVSLTPS
jgi:hypothetical protein